MAQNMGSCGYCGRGYFQVEPGRGLSDHGFTLQWGGRMGSCPGSYHPPIESSPVTMEMRINADRNYAKELREKISRIKSMRALYYDPYDPVPSVVSDFFPSFRSFTTLEEMSETTRGIFARFEPWEFDHSTQKRVYNSFPDGSEIPKLGNYFLTNFKLSEDSFPDLDGGEAFRTLKQSMLAQTKTLLSQVEDNIFRLEGLLIHWKPQPLLTGTQAEAYDRKKKALESAEYKMALFKEKLEKLIATLRKKYPYFVQGKASGSASALNVAMKKITDSLIDKFFELSKGVVPYGDLWDLLDMPELTSGLGISIVDPEYHPEHIKRVTGPMYAETRRLQREQYAKESEQRKIASDNFQQELVESEGMAMWPELIRFVQENKVASRGTKKAAKKARAPLVKAVDMFDEDLNFVFNRWHQFLLPPGEVMFPSKYIIVRGPKGNREFLLSFDDQPVWADKRAFMEDAQSRGRESGLPQGPRVYFGELAEAKRFVTRHKKELQR